MAVVALLVIALWLVLVGDVRTWLHLRAGGNTWSDSPIGEARRNGGRA